MLPPGKSKTFKDYATSVFLNYVIKQAQNIKRTDLICDQYSLALHYVLVPEVVTKNRMTFKSESFMTHSVKKFYPNGIK